MSDFADQRIGFSFDVTPDGSGNDTQVAMVLQIISTDPFENPVEFSIVPEPSTFVMLLLGAGGLAGYAVRRRRATTRRQ